MKRLLLFLFASILFFSASAQKPKAESPKADTTKTLPAGLFIFQLNGEEVSDLFNALQLSDYSKKKTDAVLSKLTGQAAFLQRLWAEQAAAQDSTKQKKKN